jgi:3-mercaptopyruvate sulfurtransferase SseA
MKMRQSIYFPRGILLAFLCAGILVCFGCPSDDDDPPPPDPSLSLLWSVSTLQNQMAAGNVIVLDCRKDVADATGTPYTPYYSTTTENPTDPGHITGSYYIDFFDFGDPYPDAAQMPTIRTTLGNLGITTSSKICLYDAGVANPQGKVFWNLERLGCTDVHILDGGWLVWFAAGGATSTTATTPPTPVTFTESLDDSIYYQLTDMLTAYNDMTGGDTTINIIDYREAPLYWGHKICPDAERHGHIPGTNLLDWHDYFDTSTSLLKTPTEIANLTITAGGSATETNVLICNKGWRSGMAYFCLRYAGWPKSSLRHYLGGIREWAAQTPTTTYPMTTEGCYTYDPTERMAAKRFAGAFAQVGTTIYCIGGYVPNTTGGVCNDALESYEITGGTWNATALNSLPAARAFSVAGTDGTDIWVFAGRDSTGTIVDTIYKYTVGTGLWSTETAVVPGGGRWSYAAASVGTTIYIGGGLTSTVGSVSANYSRDFWSFDTTSGTWDQTLPDLPYDTTESSTAHGRRCHAMVSIGTDIYLLGGFWWDDALPSPACKKDLDDVWVIDTTNTAAGWTQLQDIPSNIAGHAAAVANGNIYIPGGFTVTGIKFDVYEYTPGTDTWITKMKNTRSAQIGWPRYWYFIGASGDLIPVIGGYSAGSGNIPTTPNSGKTHFNQVYVYDLSNTFD